MTQDMKTVPKTPDTSLEPLELKLDALGRVLREGDDEKPSKTVRFHLRLLTGRDDRVITNMMFRVRRKGMSEMRPGDVAREKCVRSVTSMEGWQDTSGRPVTQLTKEIYDDFHKSVAEALLTKVREINHEDDEEEEGE